MTGLRFGPLGAGTVHAAIDMQHLFAENTEWATPSVKAIVPTVASIAAHRPERTIFTRVLTPERAEDAIGQWRIYYQRWASVLAGKLKPGTFDLLPELAAFTPPALTVDKYEHGAFATTAFQSALDQLEATAIIFTGAETDVCVLATLLMAMDRGYRCIVVSDAVASSSPEGHRACMESIFPRYDQQLEVVETETILREWNQ